VGKKSLFSPKIEVQDNKEKLERIHNQIELEKVTQGNGNGGKRGIPKV
jgi:hypothetical protein